MAEQVDRLIKKLKEVGDFIDKSNSAANEMKDVASPFGPPMNKSDLASLSTQLAERLNSIDNVRLRADWKADNLIAELEYVKSGLVPHFWNGNAPMAYIGYQATLNHVESAFSGLFQANVDWKAVSDKSLLPQQFARRLRSLNTQLANLEGKAADFDAQVTTINSAYEAAQNLPIDMDMLKEAKDQIATFKKDAEKDAFLASQSLDNTKKVLEAIVASQKEAHQIVGATAEAYSAATTLGLGAAFQIRADRTARSMWIWVAGLIIALCASALLGVNRVAIVQKMIEQKAPVALTELHTLLAILAVAAPVWFAWLATKQIGQRFRL